ncbi:hypothetical protein P3T26_005443 [Streptomyces sp. MAA16]|nr:hypothetical protein [Streptomyces sp. MAA16]
MLELLRRHEDFAPDLHGDRLGQFAGQALDGADRVRDVLARRAVAPGDQLSEAAAGVAGGDGEAVQLGFDAEPGDVVADAPGQ